MATFPNMAQPINVDDKEPAVLETVAGKDEGAGPQNRIVLHSTEPIVNFVHYLKTFAPEHPVRNPLGGQKIYLSYGSYLKGRGLGTKMADPHSLIDMGWAQTTINPGLKRPNKEAKTSLKFLNAALEGFTMVLSPANAIAKLIEKGIIKRDYYIMLSGRQDVMGLKGEVTRVLLHEWEPNTDTNTVEVDFRQIGQELEEHADMVHRINESAAAAFLRHVKDNRDYPDHKDLSDFFPTEEKH